jgi:hypothetical protein
MRRSGIVGYIVAAFILLAMTLSALIYSIALQPQQTEIILGLTVIAGVSVLTLVLFIMAAGFAALKMSDQGQALGLPQGSIRAFIALMLIVMWVIISIFLFTVVSKAMANSPILQLAQQVETTIGTLVVSVASFYFGSRSVASAVQALTAGQQPPPMIEKVEYTESELGKDSKFTITGRNFRNAKAKLVRVDSKNQTHELGVKGSPLSNDTTIICTISLPSTTDPNVVDLVGDWALLVVNEDGQKHQLEKAFTLVRPSSPTPTPPPAPTPTPPPHTIT